MNEIIRLFIQHFKENIENAEIKVTGQSVRAFLKEQKSDVSFKRFNRFTDCRGRTTNNKYVYYLPRLLSIINVDSKSIKAEREFSKNAIRTLDIYGSKRRWAQEWYILLNYAYESGCSCLLDVFGGSGFISLMASKLDIFDTVILNDLSSTIYNFHRVMKSKSHFEKFIKELQDFQYMNIEIFNSLKYDLYTELSYANKEKRQYSQVLSVRKAVELFVVKYYSYNAQGAYVDRKKAVSSFINPLQLTHNLYQHIDLYNLYYKKLLLKYINDKNYVIILDPPYLPHLREQKKSYEQEFSTRQHLTLIQLLSKRIIEAKVILCGYQESEGDGLYNRYLKRSEQEWHCIKFMKAGSLGGRGKEHIWVNFDVKCLIELTEMFEQIF